MKIFHTDREEIILLTMEEVATELGMSYRTIRRYADEGRFPVCVLGRQKYVWMRHLGQYLKGAQSAKTWKKVLPPTYDQPEFSPFWDEDRTR